MGEDILLFFLFFACRCCCIVCHFEVCALFVINTFCAVFFWCDKYCFYLSSFMLWGFGSYCYCLRFTCFLLWKGGDYYYCYCLQLTCSSLRKGGGLDRWHRSRWRRSRPGTWNDTRTRIDKRRRHHCFSLSHTHKHTSRGTYPPSRLRRLQEAALWPRYNPSLPPSSQSSKINEAPVSVDNSIQNRFATIQEVYGTIPIS